MKKQMLKDMEHMEEAMERTVNRTDIWQDRIIYWMAVALFHALTWIVKEISRREAHNEGDKIL